MGEATPEESVFTHGAPTLKFGDGASDEVGYDLAQLGCTRVLVVTDPGVAVTGLPERIAGQISRFGVEALVFTGVHVEPTDESLRAAVDWVREHGPFDGFVAVGGGLDAEHPLHPLVAVPTTTGTGSESTTVCVLDVLAQRVKSGISHPRLRPTLAVVDPLLTLTQPSGVTASAGTDILCHALESYPARAYTAVARVAPDQRVPYCGPNPVSDAYAIAGQVQLDDLY